MKLSLGIDQSTTLTGLCLIRYDDIGVPLQASWEFVECATIETPDYLSMRDEIQLFIFQYPHIVTAEGAYYGPSAEAHRNAVRSATWVEAVVCEYKIGSRFDIVPASEWRLKVWGKMPRLKSDALKAYSIQWAKDHGVPVANDHEGDALGLAVCGMMMAMEAD